MTFNPDIDHLHFTYRPTGILRSPYARRIDAPHQSTVVEGTETGEFAIATLELAFIYRLGDG